MGEKRDTPQEKLPDELRGETRSLEALRAHQLGAEAGHETPGLVGRPTEGVLSQVCLECGKEYTFDEADPPADLVCEKCGNTVFRSFFSPTGAGDDVEEDYRAMTERDLVTNDDANDVTRADVMDLDNL